ncbi:tRNA (N6-isopentenyl adenosine(37)-C2)-methylthiotransferase MiaB [Candidatus Acetothermia bacterium]|nr:tRNA (N6-isopentenyl adenosine(37)-C2)-methylthiotransferase MiaB [Candidatus Acetothermia bacterium]MCI2431864.1 tRNA (N6-isopentenyl adenosine(37)-C2)-methylthiotransferase MiaB [Candidatus Acetothermia bacterium]MCI2435969.1 tRNA (N6-isopentenyl adenosine(37)-C2)-methylthiotransferase MiaB [Candidatus Acetothermia bacterium]
MLHSALSKPAPFAIVKAMNKGRFYIFTWGCQMNEHKSEGMAGVLTEAGYQPAHDLAQADIVLFNTCMVREKPVDKLYSEAGKIAMLKEENARLLLGVGGCVAQALKERLFRKSPGIDFVFGSSNISELPQLIERARRERALGRPGWVMAVDKIPDRLEELPYLHSSRFQAKVTITEGCSNFCSFCIVPYTTGLLRSRPPGDILSEVSALAEKNYLEVQLLGQNVDSYGKDLQNPEINFAHLLRALTEIPISRIRFTSSHPQDITDDVIAVMGEENNICEHLHIAVQSGSNRVLEDMRRGYTKERFLELVRSLKEHVPGVNITTDIIVGFPTETEADFQETIDLVKKARFGGAFIFKYSPRPGTIAFYKHRDTVPSEEKQRRLEILLELQKQITHEENCRRIGEIAEVLVEGPARQEEFFMGKTRDHKTVVFSATEDLVGELVSLRVTDASVAGLMGEVISRPHSLPLPCRERVTVRV